jgi:kojibiose phosphorylase
MDDTELFSDPAIHNKGATGLLAGSGDWQVSVEGFDPARERSIETLLALANGYAGSRDLLEEGHPACRAVTFLAGVFDPILKSPEPPTESEEAPRLICGPDWFNLMIEINDEPVVLEPERLLAYDRTLDLCRSVLIQHWWQRLRSGPILQLATLRCLSLADRHLFLQRVLISLHNRSGHIRLAAVLDGRTDEALLPFTEFPAIESEYESASLSLCTAHSRVQVAMAQVCTLSEESLALPIAHRCERQARWAADQWEWQAKAGRTYVLERMVAGFTSRDVADPLMKAKRHASQVHRTGLAKLLAEHRQCWAERWYGAEIHIIGDRAAQRAVRFASHHLLGAANPEDKRVSIGAHALSGKAYRGHVFWEAEIYMLPFFIFTWPAAARALLMYRYHTLKNARAKAARLGYQGALYAWESAASGHEATAQMVHGTSGEIVPIHTGERAHHISAAIAYAIRQYWQATGDDQFFLEAGAEIVLETARFWASRAQAESDGRYHIRHTMGPDEYHQCVDDSAYVNAMARANLKFGGESVFWLKRQYPSTWQSLSARLKLKDEELENWSVVASGLVDSYCPEERQIEEFSGYFKLEDLDLRSFESRATALQEQLGHEATARTQIIKQADVVLLCYLFPEHFNLDVIEQNFNYYEPRCDHASSLSPSIHALVAARQGKLDLARDYFYQAASIDLTDRMGNTALGLHTANCGGLWQAVIFGVAGMQVTDEGLTFDPHLLPGWEALIFTVQWHGHPLKVALYNEPARAKFSLAPDAHEPMTICMGQGGRYSLAPGATISLS